MEHKPSETTHVHVLEDGTVIQKSLPIRPRSYKASPSAFIYRIRSEGMIRYVVQFASEEP